jgi:hypothetical protein
MLLHAAPDRVSQIVPMREEDAAKALKRLEAGVGIEPASTALQASAVLRQIKHFG